MVELCINTISMKAVFQYLPISIILIILLIIILNNNNTWTQQLPLQDLIPVNFAHMCIIMAIQALIIIVKDFQQPNYPWIGGDRLNEIWYFYKIEYYIVIYFYSLKSKVQNKEFRELLFVKIGRKNIYTYMLKYTLKFSGRINIKLRAWKAY